jgi:orotidine-5'-phosphate decarboxylase
LAELVLALDLPDEGSAVALLDRVPAVRRVKIGSVLFTGGGPRLVEGLKRRGLRVFVDF